MISRVERTRFAAWWWTVDRLMLGAIAVLMLAGIVLSLAASPPVATRLGPDAFYFANPPAMFPPPPDVPRSACRRHGRDFVSEPALDPARRARDVRLLPRAHRDDAGVRRRG